ncbi:hypothetical protein D3C78_1268600 [compost metagenome]
MVTPPSDFGGRAGRCGVHSLPSLNSGLPLSISFDSASTVAVTAPGARLAASSSDTSMPATGLRPAAARVFGSLDAPMETPRAVLEAVVFLAVFEAAFSASLRASISIFLRCLPAFEAISRWVSTEDASASASSCFTQSETLPLSGAPSNDDCGASSKPEGEEVEFFGDLAMGEIWRESRTK